MSKTWQRALMTAYRPMQLRGMMVEGQYRLPTTTSETRLPQRRMLLLALTAGWFRHRSKGNP
ncbi:hypothetical protein [Dyella sp. GSA-30]|uniref:hypothetical protein n=1 Tax=Dyella sp. GSA-30 TaxID=2994496 RepID=UPI00249322A4|nr:hypothetical protein [Dyella sp. GSA-30]